MFPSLFPSKNKSAMQSTESPINVHEAERPSRRSRAFKLLLQRIAFEAAIVSAAIFAISTVLTTHKVQLHYLQPVAREELKRNVRTLSHNDPHSDKRNLDQIIANFATGEQSRINSENLLALADAVAPETHNKERAHRVASAVIEAATSCSPLKIHRAFHQGSMPKRTDLLYPDLDLVLFVDKLMPPYNQVISEIKDCMEEQLPKISNAKAWPSVLQLTLDGIEVDLSLAPNFVEGPNDENTRETQQAKVVEHLKSTLLEDSKEMTSYARSFSFAVAESKVHVFENQPPFVHATARLAKLWGKNCLARATGTIQFKSILAESLAFAVAENELQTHPDNPSMVRALQEFMHKLEHPEQIHVVLSDYADSLPPWIAEQRPLIVDADIYGNIALQVKDWKTVSSAASATLSAIEAPGESSSSIADVFTCSLLVTVGRAQ